MASKLFGRRISRHHHQSTWQQKRRAVRQIHCGVELLENRLLLASDIVFEMPEPGAYEVLLEGQDLVIRAHSTGSIEFREVAEQVATLTVSGTAGTDTLILQETADGLPRLAGDLSAGPGFQVSSFLASGRTGADGSQSIGLHYAAGLGGDALEVRMISAQDVAYFTSAPDPSSNDQKRGNINIDGYLTLSFDGITPATFVNVGGDLTLDATNTPATTQLTIRDDLGDFLGPGTNIVTGDGGFETSFFRGHETLTLIGGTGSETIVLESLDPNSALTMVRLSGDNTFGTDIADDTFRIESLPSTISATVLGGGGDDSLSISAATLGTSVGDITFDGGGNGDSLTLEGSGAGSATFSATSNGSGGSLTYEGNSLEVVGLEASVIRAFADYTYVTGGSMDRINIVSQAGNPAASLAVSGTSDSVPIMPATVTDVAAINIDVGTNDDALGTDVVNYDIREALLGITSVRVELGPLDDIVNVVGSTTDVSAAFFGDDGDDRLNISGDGVSGLDTVRGIIVFDGGSHSDATTNVMPPITVKDVTRTFEQPLGDAIVVTDSLNVSDAQYTIHTDSISIDGLSISHTATESLEISTGSGANTIDVTSTPDNSAVSVMGNGGVDQFVVTTTGAGAALGLFGRDGGDSVTFDGTGANAFINVELGAGEDALQVTTTAPGTSLQVDGGGDSDSLEVAGTGDDNLLAIYGGDAVDDVSLRSIGAGSTSLLDGQGGDDQITVGDLTLDGILSDVCVEDLLGFNDLTVSDVDDADDNSYLIDDTNVNRGGMIVAHSIIGNATVLGGVGADVFEVTPSANIGFTIRGNLPAGAPDTIPGDELVIDDTGLVDLTITDDGDEGTVTASGVQPVLFFGIEILPGAAELVANDDSYTVDERGSLNIAAPGVLENDVDPEGDPLTAMILDMPANGVVTLNVDGSFSYTHDGSETTSDSFTYRANDGTGNTATATVDIAINPIDDNLVAQDDTFTVAEGGLLQIAAPGVLENDSNAFGDTLFATLLNAPTHGMLTLESDGSFTYRHDGGETTSDSFAYQADDLDGDDEVATATVTIDVTPINDSPLPMEDNFSVDEGGMLDIAAPGVLENDIDPDGDPISAALLTFPDNGTVTLDQDGSFTYVHDGGETTTDRFSYVVDDGSGDVLASTVFITVNPINDNPIAVDDSFVLDQGATLSMSAPGVLQNDNDAEDDTLAAIIDTDVMHGLLTLNSDGSFTYTHDGSDTLADGFVYEVSDGNGGTDTASVSFTIGPLNRDPIANDDEYEVDEGATLSINPPGVLENDVDADGDALTVTLLTDTSFGTLALLPDGSFDYTHDGSESPSDNFTYEVADGHGGTDTATARFTINLLNSDPVANDDAYAVDEGAKLISTTGVLENDTDDDGDPLTVTLLSDVSQGVLALDPSGNFVYTHDGSETSSDSFTYQVSDGNGSTATATVSITIRPINDPPIAVDDELIVDEGDVRVVSAPGLLVNDSDAEGDVLAISLVNGPANGTVDLGTDGTVTYTHDGSETNSDSFTYQVSDGNATALATVNVIITPVNDAPLAFPDAFTVDQGGTLEIATPGVLGNDTDVENDPLSVSLDDGPVNGQVTLNPDGSLTYIHDDSKTLTDSFTYEVADQLGASDTATVTITVNPVPETPPTIIALAYAGGRSVLGPKSSDGPSPLVHDLLVTFHSEAGLDLAQVSNPVNFSLLGDATGAVLITSVIQVSTTAAGDEVYRIVTSENLADDRYTLTIRDRVADIAGNLLDGEWQAAAPGASADGLPSGNGIEGGDFVARFTVDSRPEIGTWAGGSIYVDTNGNFVFDSENADDTNQDLVYLLGFVSDDIFAGNFTGPVNGTADGFDKIAAYGDVGTSYDAPQFRWLIDLNNDGAVGAEDINILDPANINGMPVAGEFDGNVANGDEVGIFTGRQWWFDTDHDFNVDTSVTSNLRGYPIVGDFDGNGQDDLGTYFEQGDRFEFELAGDSGGFDGTVNARFGFGFPGIRERPITADFDRDGIDDIGLWVPDRSGVVPDAQGEWYILVSGGESVLNRIEFEAIVGGTMPVVRFRTQPFGNDQFARFGDEFALPVVGNFDPPAGTGALLSTPPIEAPLAATFINVIDPLDVNADGHLTPLDVLLIINELESGKAGTLLSSMAGRMPLVDTNGDGTLTPLDALMVINAMEKSLPVAALSVRLPVEESAVATTRFTTRADVVMAESTVDPLDENSRPAAIPVWSSMRREATRQTSLIRRAHQLAESVDHVLSRLGEIDWI